METKLKARLISLTQPTIETRIPSAEALVGFCARVSSPDNQEAFDTTEKLLTYCMKNNHWSIFEMVDATVEIEAPRDISRQLLRHRSFVFQEFCITGDSKITTTTNCGRSKKVTIADLYNRQQSKRYLSQTNNLVKVYDEFKKKFVSVKIKEVFKTGIKIVYEITLVGGKSVKATLDHKFLTLDGFKILGDITKNDFVATNGLTLHQQLSWLTEAKTFAIKSGTGLQGIADLANVSYHTIRKWLKIHKITFTKKEVSSYNQIWNKGLPEELQPRFNKPHTEKSRNKMRDSSSKGLNSNLYKDGKGESWRHSVATWSRGFRMSLLAAQGYKCAISGELLTMATSEVDHIQPVYARPDLAFESSNLQVLSKASHRTKSIKENLESRQTVNYKKVLSINTVGSEETYDMEVDHDSHNYIANGIVTHNSQRYSEHIEFTAREVRQQDTKNRQNSISYEDTVFQYEMEADFRKAIQSARDMYSGLIADGVAKECARVVLPEGLTMSKLYMKGSLRSWLHYLQVREGGGTQLEHVILANKIREAITPAFPTVFKVYNESSVNHAHPL